MTVKGFLSASEGHFGLWQRMTVKMAAEEWLSKRSPAYLDVLWPMLRDSRSVAYGAPDNKALTDLHVEVCDKLELAAGHALPVGVPKQLLIAGTVEKQPPVTQEQIDAWSPVDGALMDRWLSHENAGQALALVFGRLKAKDDAAKEQVRKEKEEEREIARGVKEWFQ